MIKEVNNKFKILLLFSINLYLIKYSYNKISDANMNILIKNLLKLASFEKKETYVLK